MRSQLRGRHRGRRRVVLAGLWSTWRNPANGEEIQSCTDPDVRSECGHGGDPQPDAGHPKREPEC
jgi:hypothetical protein